MNLPLIAQVYGWSIRALSSTAAAIGGGFNVLLPPRCAGCRTAVDEPNALCPACYRDVRPLGQPCCMTCGHPFEQALGDGVADSLCGECLRDPPVFAQARAGAQYDGLVRGLVLRLKNGGSDAAGPLSALMLPAALELVEPGSVLVPIPLHRWRRMLRRYNQAQLLAEKLKGRLVRSGAADVDLKPDWLYRQKYTKRQQGLGRKARRRNVAGAFAVPDKARTAIKGRSIILVDDVYTTGATLSGAARTLLRAGAGTVTAVTPSRVIPHRAGHL